MPRPAASGCCSANGRSILARPCSARSAAAEKAKLVLDHGCDHAILYRETDFVAAVKKIVPEGVHAVFDGVGKDTFIPSFDCTRPFGMLVNYGNASGHVPPVDLLLPRQEGLALGLPSGV